MKTPTQAAVPPVNALSVDVEEYYHAQIFQEATRGTPRRSFESRVVGSVERILALFAARRIRGTFFVVGDVAASHPRLVRRIADAGHEVACHSMHHDPVAGQTPEQFRQDLRRARRVIQDAGATDVIGYRAPSYSLPPGGGWAYDVLLEEGFRYDSSVYPIRHDRYGEPGAPRFPWPVRKSGDRTLIEFPIGTLRLLGVNLPVGGGGYFRLFPGGLFRAGIRSVNRREGRPLMFYFHPWEMDPGQPRPPMPPLSALRHRVGLSRFEGKIGRLLDGLRFAPAREVLGLC